MFSGATVVASTTRITYMHSVIVNLVRLGTTPPFGGLRPIWWLNVQMIYLFYLPNGNQFLFIAGVQKTVPEVAYKHSVSACKKIDFI